MVYRPANPPAPTAPVLCSCPLTRLLLGVDGGTSRVQARWGDRGVCDPAQLLGIMMVVIFCLPRGSPHPPNGPRPFRQRRSSLGGCFVFCVPTLQLKLGPPKVGCSFSVLLGSCISSRHKGWVWEFFGSVWNLLSFLLAFLCVKTARNAARFSVWLFLRLWCIPFESSPFLRGCSERIFV